VTETIALGRTRRDSKCPRESQAAALEAAAQILVAFAARYAIADLPSNFRPAAQVLLRRRDRNMRLRVLQHFRPAQDQQPEAMRISKQTNSSKLGSAIMSKFVDVAGNNLQRSAWALGELYMSIWGKGEANVPQLWLRISPDSSRALQAGN
ncbi:unnamed protein product, partial [Effrenium voratum]